MGLLIATLREFVKADKYVRSGLWKAQNYPLSVGSLRDRKVGFVGMGRIGQAIARRGRFGFGMKVAYHNRSRLPAEAEAELGARYLTKDELLRQADHLVLVLPYSAQSHHCIAAAEIALMKPTATLINIARGGIVDEDALAAALRGLSRPVIGRIQDDRLLLDLRCLEEPALLTAQLGALKEALA